MRRTIRILSLALVLCFALSAMALTANAAELTPEEAMEYLDSYSDNVASDPDFDGNIVAAIDTARDDVSIYAELNEPLHLLFEALAVMLDGLLGHHGTHIGTTGRVADHGGTAANQGDGPVSGHLQPLHQAQSHKVAHMEGVSGGDRKSVV